jgi:hypothetical protein
MGVIKSLFLKEIVTEKTGSKALKIIPIICYIAAILVVIIGFINLANMDVLPPEEMDKPVRDMLVGMGVFVLLGWIFELTSEIRLMRSEIKMLKDKIGEQ